MSYSDFYSGRIWARLLFTLVVTSPCYSPVLAAEAPPANPEFDKILSLDIADLVVTSVSKRDEKLSNAAAAVYIITQEDLHRSGITTVPEALRMVPGVQVARVGSNRWAITARGFNSLFANKLLVLIDGRSVYTPLYSGTYWDDQTLPMEDIERIEVIRGPGASLWGANAVNGIINIITKPASKTQGNLVSSGVGTGEDFMTLQQGGKSGDDMFYRAYAQYHYYNATEDMSHKGNNDNWYRADTGFRVDGTLKSGDSYSLQGAVRGGENGVNPTVPVPAAPFARTTTGDDAAYGGTIFGLWKHGISKDSEITVQAYLDHYSREEDIGTQHISTADIEFQNNMRLDDRNNFVWGSGARVYYEDLIGTFEANVKDRYDTHEVLNLFLQDEYALVPDRVFITAGSKFEYNDFTGIEIQPSARLSWRATDTQTLWGAVSRAVRTPSSIEHDISLVTSITPGAPPTETRLTGNPVHESEEVIAYELGYRIQPIQPLSFDTALFYNQFDDLTTFGPAGAPFLGSDGNLIVPVYFSNLGSGHVYGAEIAANWDISRDWRLAGSYTLLKMDLDQEPAALNSLAQQAQLSPEHQFSIRSYVNLTEAVRWDNMVYFVDNLSAPVSAYVRYDTRVAWDPMPGLEVSLIGRNLLDSSHPEFPATADPFPVMPQAQIEREVLGQIMWKF